jgi:hypothetical protein
MRAMKDDTTRRYAVPATRKPTPPGRAAGMPSGLGGGLSIERSPGARQQASARMVDSLRRQIDRPGGAEKMAMMIRAMLQQAD